MNNNINVEKVETKTQFLDNLENTILYSGVSFYSNTESGKERLEIAKTIMEQLKRKRIMTVNDLQASNKRLNECSLQRISGILKGLEDNGNVKRDIINKSSFFSIN